VDTPAQLGVLRALGCRYAQGALLGPAVPAAELAALVDAFDPRLLDVAEDQLSPAVLDGVSA
jgi:sensor c-di-GMP phosphodiesterase-like protein